MKTSRTRARIELRRMIPAAVLLAAAAVALLGACTSGEAGGPVLPPTTPIPAEAPTPQVPAANQPPAQKQPPAVPSIPGLDQTGHGRLLYGAGCASCHGQQGAGTERGPSLLDVGPASVDFQLSSGRMPLNQPVPQPERKPPTYNRSDIDALVAYVGSLGPGGPPIPELPAGNPRAGRELFLLNCASCHSSTGVGAALPDGRIAPSLLNVPSTQVAEAIRVGPGPMPQFPATALSDQQAADIVAYVTTLPTYSDHGGWPIGAVGPVTEGIVGWALGLGLLVVVIRLLGKKAPR